MNHLYNRMFILISHYYIIVHVFETHTEKQRFAFTTRGGSRILCKGGRNSVRGLGTLSRRVLSIIEAFPAATLKHFIKYVMNFIQTIKKLCHSPDNGQKKPIWWKGKLNSMNWGVRQDASLSFSFFLGGGCHWKLSCCDGLPNWHFWIDNASLPISPNTVTSYFKIPSTRKISLLELRSSLNPFSC